MFSAAVVYIIYIRNQLRYYSVYQMACIGVFSNDTNRERKNYGDHIFPLQPVGLKVT